MRRLAILLPCVLPVTLLPAQAVTLSATVVSTTVSAQSGTLTPITNQLPAGTAVPFPVQTAVTSGQGLSFAILSSSLLNHSTKAELTVTESVYVQTQGAASVAADIMMNVTATQPLPARVELEWIRGVAPGGALPYVAADTDNNGVFEMVGAPGQIVSSSIQLTGTRSMVLRVNSTGTPGLTSALHPTINLRVVPDQPNIGAQTVLTGCGDYQLIADETFIPGLLLRPDGVSVPTGSLTVLAIGFTPTFAPLPLGPACFLLPSPDLVVTEFRDPIRLDATLGPLQFYAQGVVLGTGIVGRDQASNGLYVRL